MQFHCGVFQSCMSPCPHFHTLMGRVQVYISFTLLGTGVKLLNATASAHWGLVVSASLYTELSRFSVQCTRTALPTPKNAPLCKLSLLALHIFHSHVLGCLGWVCARQDFLTYCQICSRSRARVCVSQPPNLHLIFTAFPCSLNGQSLPLYPSDYFRWFEVLSRHFSSGQGRTQGVLQHRQLVLEHDVDPLYIHTHTHTHVCVCVCVCVDPRLRVACQSKNKMSMCRD